MKQIIKYIMVVFLFTIFTENGHSQITKSKYEIIFDENTCLYNVYLHVIEGSAVEIIERIPFNSGVSLVMPVEAKGTVVESITPSSTTWNAFNQSGLPGGDTDKNFFNINQSPQSNNTYPVMNEGDVIHLFSFSVDFDFQGLKGMRPYDSSLDDPGGGGVFGSSFVLLNINSHTGFLDTQFGSDYAKTTGPSTLYVGTKTTLEGPGAGSWTQSNPAVTSFDPVTNEVTALALGRSVFTFTPNAGCASSVEIEVVEIDSTSQDVTITLEPVFEDPSAIMGVYNEENGILIPSLSQNERLCIAAPAVGLLIYQTDFDKGYFYFDGAAWKRLSDTLASGTSSNTSSAQVSMSVLLEELVTKNKMLQTTFNEQAKTLSDLEEQINN